MSWLFFYNTNAGVNEPRVDKIRINIGIRKRVFGRERKILFIIISFIRIYRRVREKKSDTRARVYLYFKRIRRSKGKNLA